MKKIWLTITILFISILGNNLSAYATNDKILLQVLAEIKEMKGELRQIDKRIDDLRSEMNARFEQIDKRFEQVDKRFEQIDKRFEQVDRRFEQVDKRFEQVDRRFAEQMTYWGWIIAGMFSLLAVFVALLLWDRRTAVRAAIKESKKEILTEIEKEYQMSLLEKMLEAFRRKAKTDKELASILKNLGLL